MPRTLPPWLGVAVVLAALACESEPRSPDGDAAPRVVFVGDDGEAVPPPSASAIRGRELGGREGAPEVIVLGDPAPEQPTRVRTAREPAPGPTIVYETVYVDAEAPAPSREPAPPQPAEVAEPAPEPEGESAAEARPAPEPIASETGTNDEPIWTGRVPTPDRSPNRAEDAIVGAAIGAGIGAVLGGRDGAIRGGVGGAVGGAVGGRTGAILGGVLGAGGRRGGVGRRGGGCWAPARIGARSDVLRAIPGGDVRATTR